MKKVKATVASLLLAVMLCGAFGVTSVRAYDGGPQDKKDSKSGQPDKKEEPSDAQKAAEALLAWIISILS